MSSSIGGITSSSKFTWTIRNFSRLNCQRGHKSEVFSVGSYKWRLWIYPKGFQVHDQLSLYIVREDVTRMPYTDMTFVVTSQTDRRNDVTAKISHQFVRRDAGWGAPYLINLNELHDPSNGYLLRDTCVIEVEISCEEGS